MDLFLSSRSRFRVSRLSEKDALERNSLLDDFRMAVKHKERSYPEIGSWIDKQVVAQLGRPDRVAYVAHLDNRPVGTIVFKISDRLKLCHLHIVENARRESLGEVFLGLLALHKGTSVDEIYFTIPESVWEQQSGFFERFQFKYRGQATRQYRLFDKELYCTASFSAYSRVALKRLGDLSEELRFGTADQSPALLLSMHPRFAGAIFRGGKSVEIRRKFDKNWIGHRIAIYASSPEQSVVGEATIGMIDNAGPDEIWGRYSSRIGCERKEFDRYCSDSLVVSAIVLEDVIKFATPVKRSALVSMFGKRMHPPQSYFLLRNTGPWSDAVSIARTLSAAEVTGRY